MTNLNCTERDCCNNCDGCCGLETITVEGGQNAVCRSYRAGGGATNALSGTAEPETEIRCGEHDCCHNENCCCRSGRVEIDPCSCGPKCRNFER